MTTYIKQYGIQRSCTNFVKVLLENNLDDTVVLTNILGWKHGPHKDKIDWEGNDFFSSTINLRICFSTSEGNPLFWRGFPITTSKGSVIKNPKDKFSDKALKQSKYQSDLKRFNEGITNRDPRKKGKK